MAKQEGAFTELTEKEIEELKLSTKPEKNRMFVDLRKIDEDKRKEAIPLLYDKNLFDKIVKEISLKVVGEEGTVKTIFLCSCGRLVTNNQVASYNLLVNDESGIGKDYVTDNTLDIWHNAVKFKRTRISPTAFTYWKRLNKRQRELGHPEWNWDGKIVYLEDVSNNVLNSEVFKVMCSSGAESTIVKDQVAQDIKINGKPVIIITSASAVPNTENIRRFSIVNLDSSIDQTKAIIERQAERAESGLRIDYDPTITSTLTYLDRFPVKIPYASMLKEIVPDGMVMRTHFMRILDLIKASCCLYQYQRKMDSEGFLIATEQDYEITRDVIEKITSNPKMVSLTKNQQKILDIIGNLPKDLSYSVTELEPKVTFMSDRQLRRELDKLTDLGFLSKDKEERAEAKKPVMVYKLKNLLKIDIPTWKKLQDSVKCVK